MSNNPTRRQQVLSLVAEALLDVAKGDLVDDAAVWADIDKLLQAPAAQTSIANSSLNSGGTNWEALQCLPYEEIHFETDAPRTSAEDWIDAVAHHGLPIRNLVRSGSIAKSVSSDQ